MTKHQLIDVAIAGAVSGALTILGVVANVYKDKPYGIAAGLVATWLAAFALKRRLPSAP